MRLPGAALLITIGLVLLWLATSGNLDRLGVAWQTIISDPRLSPETGGTAKAACDPSKGICDFSNYAVANMLNTLTPEVSSVNPGGML